MFSSCILTLSLYIYSLQITCQLHDWVLPYSNGASGNEFYISQSSNERARTRTHLCWLMGVVLDVIYRECFFVHYLFSAQINQTIFATIYPIELHPSAASSERSRIRHTHGRQVWSSQWSSHLPHEKNKTKQHTHCREEIGSSEKELKLTRTVPEGETKRRESRCWLWIVCHYIYWVTMLAVTGSCHHN